MTILPDIPEIEFWGIYDKGIPYKERIVFRPRVPIDLGRYVICVGVTQPSGLIVPLHDHTFWSAGLVVEPPSWVFIFTCAGKSSVTVESITQAPLHTLYWGRNTTIFNIPELTAAIMRLDGINIAPEDVLKLDESDRRPVLKGPNPPT